MELDEIIKEQMDNVVDTDALSNLTDSCDIQDILEKTINGESIFQPETIIDSLKDLFFLEIKSALFCGIEILSICIFIGLLQNLEVSFGKKNTSKISQLVCVITVVGIILTNYTQSYNLAVETIKKMTSTMEILVPVLLGLLLAMGKLTSSSILSPLILTCITIFQIVIEKIVLPALFMSTSFNLINCLTEKDYVNQLASFINKSALFLMGFILTLMSGIISVQGIITNASDSLIIGTAKYSLNAFIPIVGGFTADTIEVFLKCMNTIKSVVGVFGIIVIITIMLTPLLKILSISIIYKITAILTEPIANPKITKGISSVGSTLISVGAVVFFSSLLFIIFITAIIIGLK